MDELRPGQTLLRKDVHRLYGGREQGGIGPSKKTPTVLFFTDPVTGHKHGYYDGWDDDGLFNYTGEGQRGDQRLVQGNKAIVTHAEEGRTLKGFYAHGTSVTFMGDFELADLYWTDAPDTDGVVRQVVVFRLRPLTDTADIPLPPAPVTIAEVDRIEAVPIEERHTERAVVSPMREQYEYERRESLLVTRYADHLRRTGHNVSRLCIIPKGESAPIYSDLWDMTADELIEAKGLVTREQIRMAVGQLFDYSRFVDRQRLTILLPEKPRADLLAFTRAVKVDVVYPLGEDWARN